MSVISEIPQSFPPPEDGPKQGDPRENMQSPWQGSPASLDKLYKEIYYSRRIQKLLSQEPEDIVKVEVKKRVEARLIFQIAYNVLLIVSLVFIALNLSKTFLSRGSNENAGQLGVNVMNSSIPVHLDAGFGESSSRIYSDKESNLQKTLSPDKPVKLSIFIDLRNLQELGFLEVKVSNLPDWFSYSTDSASILYAEIMSDEDSLKRLNLTSGAIISYPPIEANNTLTFLIDVPEDYFSFDGLCLDFQIDPVSEPENKDKPSNGDIRLNIDAYKIS